MPDIASPSPPAMPSHPLWRLETTSYLINGTGSDPDAYLRGILTCLEQFSKNSCVVVRHKPHSSLKIVVAPRCGGQFLLKIKLYTVDCERGRWACEWQRRRGCAIAFHHTFNAFLRKSIRKPRF